MNVTGGTLHRRAFARKAGPMRLSTAKRSIGRKLEFYSGRIKQLESSGPSLPGRKVDKGRRPEPMAISSSGSVRPFHHADDSRAIPAWMTWAKSGWPKPPWNFSA